MAKYFYILMAVLLEITSRDEKCASPLGGNSANFDKDELSYDMRLVSQARFAMARRLEYCAKIKSFLVNGLTAISIFLSSALLIADERVVPIQFVAVSLIGISIFIMWMSLDNSPHEMEVRSREARRCAEDINGLRKRLDTGNIDSSVALDEYLQCIKNFKENHDDADRNYARYNLRHKFPNKIKNAGFFENCIPYFIMRMWYLILFAVWALSVLAVAEAFSSQTVI